jgi:dephospho-CoA kinase
MTRRLRIGLTGGIASGKSTVAARFQELGVPVIDADEVARAVVAPGQPVLSEIAKLFGKSVLTPGGNLDRPALRELIFADPDLRRGLESILHPLIHAEMERRAALARGPYVVLAIPLLVEGGGRYELDRILVVDADETDQVERLLARDGGSAQQARAILAAQADRDRRLAQATDVLENKGSVATLRHSVDRLHEIYLHAASDMASGR